jgi:hypothetical protein
VTHYFYAPCWPALSLRREIMQKFAKIAPLKIDRFYPTFVCSEGLELSVGAEIMVARSSSHAPPFLQMASLALNSCTRQSSQQTQPTTLSQVICVNPDDLTVCSPQLSDLFVVLAKLRARCAAPTERWMTLRSRYEWCSNGVRMVYEWCTNGVRMRVQLCRYPIIRVTILVSAH